jgi:AcrR family transcriptional regulator
MPAKRLQSSRPDRSGQGGQQQREAKGGFSSIWLQPERTPRSAQASLSRRQIVRAAIAIAEAEGFEAVTMRRVAAELGVGTMSLYWHVPTKDNLLELMRDELMGEVAMPDPPSGDWRADLRFIAHQTRANMKRHPWMLAIFASLPSIGPNMMRHADLSLAAIDGLGLDLQTMFLIMNVVDDYTLGFTLGEVNQEVARRQIGLSPDELREQWFTDIEPFTRDAIATGKYPRLARLENDPIDFMDTDRIFEFGLECVLDGIAVRIEAARGERRA